MESEDRERIDAVLDYWFGPGRRDGSFDEARVGMWFGGGSAVDEHLREHFLGDAEAAAAGRLSHWKTAPEGWLALIILLDQFPRNLHRNTPAAFAQDPKAQALSLEGLEAGVDRRLRPIQRVFFYMPLEHAEDRAVQARSVAAFRALRSEAGPTFEQFLDYALRHQVVIERFGRFPDLNPILGRESTPGELAFLEQPGSSFL